MLNIRMPYLTHKIGQINNHDNSESKYPSYSIETLWTEDVISNYCIGRKKSIGQKRTRKYDWAICK